MSVTGVGREQDRTNGCPEVRKALRNRYSYTSKYRIEPPDSAELPQVEGLSELWGRGGFHCPYCHGFEVRDTALAVLGATPSAVNLALHLRRSSDDVVLCTDGPAELGTQTLLDRHGVKVRQEPVARIEGRDVHLERVVFADGEPLARHALFCGASRTRQRSELPAGLGCSLFEDGCVEVDDFARTSVDGVYAVGDMARRAGMPGPAAAVIAAAASGTVAGTVIDKELLADDLGLPNPLASAPAGAKG